METPNPYEAHAREVKVARLVDTALSAYDGEGFTADDLEAFTPEQWELLADCAGVRSPSEVTKALTLTALRAAVAERSTADDPFVGL